MGVWSVFLNVFAEKKTHVLACSVFEFVCVCVWIRANLDVNALGSTVFCVSGITQCLSTSARVIYFFSKQLKFWSVRVDFGRVDLFRARENCSFYKTRRY